MKKVVRLTESDLIRLVNRVLNESPEEEEFDKYFGGDYNYDIKSFDCKNEKSYNDNSVDVEFDDNDNPIITIRYCKGNEKQLHDLKRKGIMLLHSQYGLDDVWFTGSKSNKLTESDSTKLVRRIIKEQYNVDQEELSNYNVVEDVEYRLDEFKNEMENLLSELQSNGQVDKRRFMSRIKNGTMEIYREILNSLDNRDKQSINMLDKTFSHKQQGLYGYFLDKF